MMVKERSTSVNSTAISVIIPTYNEAGAIGSLIPKVCRVIGERDELIIVDDHSPDGTADIVEGLAQQYPVKLVRRKGPRDLSLSVLDGFSVATNSLWCVMDGDLSHNPMFIPRMIEEIQRGADIVIGSRLVPGGEVERWPESRRLISKIGIFLSRPLVNVYDPMSGFFMLRRKVLENVSLRPRGYKILLEILVRGRWQRAAEIPIVFVNRMFGKSKLSGRIYKDYLLQLVRLYSFRLKN